MIKMEEMTPERIGEDIGAFCRKMYLRVKEDGDPVTALVNDVRIVMFKEERIVDPQYDGPR
jgi:NADPH-dependent 7-cyano-7-deazaguanine reductase QueF